MPRTNYSQKVDLFQKKEINDSPKVATDTVYINKSVFEKCLKKHCESEVTPQHSQEEITKPIDSINN